MANTATPIHQRAADIPSLEPLPLGNRSTEFHAPPPVGVPPTSTGTPSPLTISARVIEAGSLDFTEFATGLDVSSTSVSPRGYTGTSEFHHLNSDKEGALSKTLAPSATPLVSSPMSGHVRVKVSTRKLREIQPPSLTPSPHPLRMTGAHSASHDGSYLSSSARATSSTPAALTPQSTTAAAGTALQHSNPPTGL